MVQTPNQDELQAHEECSFPSKLENRCLLFDTKNFGYVLSHVQQNSVHGFGVRQKIKEIAGNLPEMSLWGAANVQNPRVYRRVPHENCY